MALWDLAIQMSAQRKSAPSILMETSALSVHLAHQSYVLNLSHFNVLHAQIKYALIQMIYLKSITITTMVFHTLLRYTRMAQLLKNLQEKLFQQLVVSTILKSTFRQTSTLLTHTLKPLIPSMENHMSSIFSKMALSFQRLTIKPFVQLEERFA